MVRGMGSAGNEVWARGTGGIMGRVAQGGKFPALGERLLTIVSAADPGCPA